MKDMRIVALARLAQRWENGCAFSAVEAEATLNLRHFPGYYSIAWTLRFRCAGLSRDTTQIEALVLRFSMIMLSPGSPDPGHDRAAAEYADGVKGFLFAAGQHGQDGAGFVVGLFAFHELLEVFSRTLPLAVGLHFMMMEEVIAAVV
jgi:hypothetical protein